MKKRLFLLMMLTGMYACIPAETEFSKEANRPGQKPEEEEVDPDDPLPTDPVDYQGIEPRLFELINFDAPGLEAAKAQIEQKDMVGATQALIDYFKTRDIVNPGIDLADKYISASGKSIADQALQHRFYTISYDQGTGEDGQRAFFDNNDANGQIDWVNAPAGVSDKTEYIKQIHRLMWMPYQAQAYNATGDERYVQSIMEVYDSYLEKYPVPSGKGSGTPWTGLQISVRLLNWLDILPYIVSSPSVTPQWMAKMLVFTHDALECLRNTWYTPSSSNIYFSQVQALIENAIFFPEYKKGQEWFDDGISLVSSQLSDQFNEDGVQNELDPSYHLGVVANFQAIQEFAVANKRSGQFPDDYTDRLKGSCRFMMDIVYPDYTFENFNDSRSSHSSKNVTLRNLRNYSAMFPEDGELLWASTDRTQGTEPTSLVQKYPVSGYYMLREGWSSSAMMLILKNNYNPTNAWHCQPDNGTVALWKKGRRFLPDGGVFTYTNGSTRNSFAATANHNTLTKNKGTLASGAMLGKFLAHQSTDSYEVVVTENPSYGDLTHRRAVFMVNKSFYVIVDEGYGKAAAPVNVQWHLSADTKGSLGEAASVIDDLSASHAYGAHTVYPDGNNFAYRTFCETTDGFTAENGTSWVSDEIDERYSRRFYRVTLTKDAEKAARFITVLYPITAEVPDIKASFTDNTPGTEGTFHPEGCTVKVSIDGSEHALSYKL